MRRNEGEGRLPLFFVDLTKTCVRDIIVILGKGCSVFVYKL